MDKKDEKEIPAVRERLRQRPTQEDFDDMIRKSRELIERVDSYLSKNRSDKP